MFNLGFGELAVILIVLLIVVGPSRLPTLMKTAGKTIRSLRTASRDIRTSIGFDELMREDYLQPPRPRVVPPRTAARAAPAQPADAAPKAAEPAPATGASDASNAPTATPAPTPEAKPSGETH